MQDLISIVIPTYNGGKYIGECIESIQAQDFPYEIIVIDDISKDNTAAIAREMGARVIVNEVHKGQVAGKNTGIREAKGNYWLTIDQDDKLVAGALRRLYDELQDGSMIVMAKLRDFPQTPDQQKFCHPEPFRGILTGSTLFKTEVFNLIGDFREDIITGDVIDLTNRLSQHDIEIKKVDFITCNRRIHDENFGRTNQKDEYKDYLKVLRERMSMKKPAG